MPERSGLVARRTRTRGAGGATTAFRRPPHEDDALASSAFPRFRAARCDRASWLSAARGLAALLVCAGAVPALAADPQPYATTLVPTGNAALDTALRGSSSLLTLQKTQAVGPFALAGRARADIDRLRTALESFGYYGGRIDITVDGVPVSDPSVPERLGALPAGRAAAIRIAVTTGPMFHLGQVSLRTPDGKDAAPVLSAPQRDAFGLRTGQPAVASDVLAARGRLLSALQEDGYALADVREPVAYLRPDSRTLDIVETVKEGARFDIGAIRLQDLKRVDPAFVRRRLLVHPGELYQPSRIEAARQDLASLGVFSDVGVQADTAGAANGALPLTFDFTEALRHTVALQGGFSTDLGGSAGVTWTHHNLFGQAEQLRLVALLTGLGGTAQQGLGYDIYADFTKPDFLHRDQTLDARIEGLKQNLQAYDQTALLARVGVSRKLGRRWLVGAGVGAEEERIVQQGVTRNYTLVSLPLSANYDSTDLANPLDSATHGFRVALSATPTYSLGSGDNSGDSVTNQGGNSFFTILQATASTYFDLSHLGLSRPGRSVLALRAVVGSVQGASTFELPPDQRLYAGGSGTVRGYQYQGVGPLFPNNDPIGGTSVDAGTVEFRQRIGKSFGAAAFVDAGQVSANSAPFEGTLRVGAGVGARYYTPIGPIRLDVAVPLNKPPGGDNFELYIGLGEAF